MRKEGLLAGNPELNFTSMLPELAGLPRARQLHCSRCWWPLQCLPQGQEQAVSASETLRVHRARISRPWPPMPPMAAAAPSNARAPRPASCQGKVTALPGVVQAALASRQPRDVMAAPSAWTSLTSAAANSRTRMPALRWRAVPRAPRRPLCQRQRPRRHPQGRRPATRSVSHWPPVGNPHLPQNLRVQDMDARSAEVTCMKKSGGRKVRPSLITSTSF
mmetsp:Transcript_122450/g.357508  ORF Transcript_122450/g.357508 Transcript_122450/m.357508 type:complete len:219 (-) Transcript_122450:1112-1768(-)